MHCSKYAFLRCDEYHLVLVKGLKAETLILTGHVHQTEIKAAFQNLIQGKNVVDCHSGWMLK